MIINMIHENKNLLSLLLFSFLVGLRAYQHPCIYMCVCVCVYINIYIVMLISP